MLTNCMVERKVEAAGIEPAQGSRRSFRSDVSRRVQSRAQASHPLTAELLRSGTRRRRASRRGDRGSCQRELDGLVPRHRSSFVEGSAGSRLAEPGAGCAEVALAPGSHRTGGGRGTAPSSSYFASTAPSRRSASSSRPRPAAVKARPRISMACCITFPLRERGFEGAQPVLARRGCSRAGAWRSRLR